MVRKNMSSLPSSVLLTTLGYTLGQMIWRLEDGDAVFPLPFAGVEELDHYSIAEGIAHAFGATVSEVISAVSNGTVTRNSILNTKRQRTRKPVHA